MRLGFAMRALNGVLRVLERRPWCIAGVYLLMELLKYLALAILFTNHCPSTLRFVPELSDEFAAWVSDIYDFSLKAAAVVGAVMLVAPVIPMVFRRYRTVVVMLVLGIAVMETGMRSLDLIPWSCRSVLAEQMRVVRLNVERKKEAQRQGKTECLRVPVHKFEVRQWYFHNERYQIYHPYNSLDKNYYYLSDRKWRPDRYAKDMWESRVILDDVVHWGECGQQLHLETKDGRRYVLDYATGDLKQQEGNQ